MTITELFLATQTVAVVVTGGFVVWYTVETYRLRKAGQRQVMGLERSSEIAATSALPSSYTQYLSIIEQKNNILFSEKRGVSHDTSEIRQKIDALEKRLESLVSTPDA